MATYCSWLRALECPMEISTARMALEYKPIVTQEKGLNELADAARSTDGRFHPEVTTRSADPKAVRRRGQATCPFDR